MSAVNIGGILEALKLIESLGKQIANTWDKIKTHAEEVEDEKDRAALLDAIERRDADYIRHHLFM